MGAEHIVVAAVEHIAVVVVERTVAAVVGRTVAVVEERTAVVMEAHTAVEAEASAVARMVGEPVVVVAVMKPPYEAEGPRDAVDAYSNYQSTT